jgi:hypothetical protein
MKPFNRTVHRARNQGRRRGIDLVLERCEDRVLLSTTYAVTTTEDALDNSNQPVVGSLRWAIDQANATPGGGATTIVFDIPLSDPGAVFISSSPSLFFDLALNPQLGPLTITQPVVIDGFTEADYLNAQTEGVQVPRVPLVMINGSALAAQSASASLIVEVSPSGAQPPPGATIEGLAFAGMSGGAGILLDGGQGNVIEGNLIGTDITGTSTTAAGKNSDGVPVSFPTPNQYGVVVDASNDNLIGGPAETPATGRDIISGNTSDGILIENGSQANQVENVYIGTDVTGTVKLGNGGSGVDINASGTRGNGNSVGGTISGLVNVISGNGAGGVFIQGGASSNVIQNDLIGSDVNGRVALPNAVGVEILASSNNTVGSAVAGLTNLISGNTGAGVIISGSASSQNAVVNSLIGPDLTGSNTQYVLHNGGDGIDVVDAVGTMVGFSGPVASPTGGGNTISGNSGDGVSIGGSAAGTVLLFNKIGTDGTGTSTSSALANGGYGVVVNSTSTTGSTIGGTIAVSTLGQPLQGAFNLISGNTQGGVELEGQGSNHVSGNLIGTDITGTRPLGNLGDGIDVIGAPSSMIGGTEAIGGTAAGTGNLISANSGSGVSILGTKAAGTEVFGNVIGTNISQTAALGNADSGVVIAGSTADSIGIASTGNRIAGNQGDGVDIVRGSSGNTVVSNTIGGVVASTQGGAGSALIGNAGDGIDIVDSPGNTIGSQPTQMTAVGTPDQLNLDANQIVGNGGDGVLLSMSESFPAANSITGNLVARNSQNGIHVIGDLSGDLSLVEINDNYVGTLLDGTDTYDADGQPQGNGLSGILLESTGTSPGAGLPSTSLVAATISGNVVSNNGSSGVTVRSATTAMVPVIALIENNAIGTDKAGQLVSSLSGTGTSQPFGNGLDGIFLDHVTGVTVGGTAGLGNVISGNKGNGVDAVQASSIVIAGNEIGTDREGFSLPGSATSDMGNATNGILINQSSQVTVGGLASGAGNIVSGNHSSGIFVSGTVTNPAAAAYADQNVIEGNEIGLGMVPGQGGRFQTGAVPNAVAGVILSNASSNTIGGTAPGAANVISGNSLDGIVLVNDASNNAVVNNLVGTDPSGNVAMGNSAGGIFLLGSNAIAIGGVTPNTTPSTISGNTIAGNVIAGNTMDGVEVFGTGATGNAVSGNWIGLSRAGNPVRNGADGVLLDDAGPSNLVGGAGRPNIISGNGQAGVDITGSPDATIGTLVAGNFIGTDPSGLSAVANGSYGVLVYGSSSNTIGGATASPGTGAGNVISGNSQAGIFIYNPVGSQATGNSVLGNLIGTNANGTGAVPNGSDGVEIENASGNVVGGVSPVDRNVISGNADDGVLIVQSPSLAASGNRILGNFIGTNAAGTAGLGNRGNGVELVDGSANVVGGISGGATLLGTEVPSGAGPNGEPGNLISGNGQWGVLVRLTGASAGQPQSAIEGNVIGLDASRTFAIPNVQGGVSVNNATTQFLGQTIGGSVAGSGNLISGNANVGIQLVGAQAVGTGLNDVVQGNLIGLNAAGRVVGTGNGTGIVLSNSPNDLIGGTSPAARNVISGNSQSGIQISDVLSTGDMVLGNFVGTNLAGDAYPTGSSEGDPGQGTGVLISGATGAVIGQDVPGAGNIISGNAVGVMITGVVSNNGQSLGSVNVVAGNLIGTDVTGTRPVSNLDLGVFVNNSQSNVIGPGNVLSANGIAGAEIVGSESQFNVIAGNIVGTGIGGQRFTSKGRKVLSSNGPERGIPVFADAQLNGVVIIGASQNTIGVDTRIAGSAPNTISGNVQVGVYIVNRDYQGHAFPVPTRNVVSGNTLRSNGIYGLLLYNAPNNFVRPYTTSSRFLFTNQFGGQQINFRDYRAGFEAGTSLPTSGPKPRQRAKAAHVPHRQMAQHVAVRAGSNHHVNAAHVLHPSRPRVRALFEGGHPLRRATAASAHGSGAAIRVIPGKNDHRGGDVSVIGPAPRPATVDIEHHDRLGIKRLRTGDPGGE